MFRRCAKQTSSSGANSFSITIVLCAASVARVRGNFIKVHDHVNVELRIMIKAEFWFPSLPISLSSVRFSKSASCAAVPFALERTSVGR